MSDQVKTLYLLRHAKSAWDTGAADDFSRPLNQRGEEDAPKIGLWLQQQDLAPECVISSPALRAWQTITAVCHVLNIDTQTIHFDRRLYLASRSDLCHIIEQTGDNFDSLLLVGHNPGLDELLEYLVGGELPRTSSGKLLTTASLAIVQLPNWHPLKRHQAHLLELIRPKSLA